MALTGNTYYPENGDTPAVYNAGFEANATIIDANETAVATKADATATQTALDAKVDEATPTTTQTAADNALAGNQGLLSIGGYDDLRVAKNLDSFVVCESDSTLYWNKFATITRTGGFPLCDISMEIVGRIGRVSTLILGQEGTSSSFTNESLIDTAITTDGNAPLYCYVASADEIALYSKQKQTFQSSSVRVVAKNFSNADIVFSLDNAGVSDPVGAVFAEARVISWT